MSWLRVDDGFHDDPAIDRVGNEAAGAYIRCSAYCADKRTDGFISRRRALFIATARVYRILEGERLMLRVDYQDEHTITGRKDSGRRPLADVTVTMPEDGWFIPAYLRYNFAAAEVKRGGRAPESTGESTGESAGAHAGVLQVSAPTPDPTPITNLQVLKEMGS